MRANEYQTRAMSTRLPSCGNAIYMLFGLMAEVGEIADKIAKWRRKGVCRLDMDHLVFNTGDLQEVEGYTIILCSILMKFAQLKYQEKMS